ncbi:MAG: DUF4214 domain-containing protein [Clostridiales bacterium]|nr:DUF4214 domain-containing protein [Clostridiales bacterium]
MKGFRSKVIVTALAVSMFLGSTTVAAAPTPSLQTLAMATRIYNGRTVDVEIGAEEKGEAYKYTAYSAGYYYIFSFHNVNADNEQPNFDPYVYLYDSQGNLINYDDNGADNGRNDFFVEQYLEAGETIYIFATKSIDDSEGAYSLQIREDRIPSPDLTTPLSFGEEIIVDPGSGEKEHMYSFVPDETMVYGFYAYDRSDLVSYDAVYIYNSELKLVHSAVVGGEYNAHFEYQLNAGETYYIYTTSGVQNAHYILGICKTEPDPADVLLSVPDITINRNDLHGETKIRVPINIYNNPGFRWADIYLSFDSTLDCSLFSQSESPRICGAYLVECRDYIHCSFDGGEFPILYDGEIGYLEVFIPEDIADGVYNISVLDSVASYETGIYLYPGNSEDLFMTCNTRSGSITIVTDNADTPSQDAPEEGQTSQPGQEQTSTEETTAPASNQSTEPAGNPSSVSVAAPTSNPAPADAPVISSRNYSIGDFVERLYTVALGRNSDPVGKQDWIDAVTMRGQTGADLARGFLYSPEFLGKNVSNEDFVRTLYRTFFDREADADGLNAWVAVLDNGGSKEGVIEGFINSTEWANLCLLYGVRSGGTGTPNVQVKPNQATIDFATRLYTTCLSRSADENGLMAWARQLANQRDTGTGAARGFFFSNEFLGQNVSNEEYVNRLYRTFMGREADEAGFTAWVAQLNEGVSREAVFNGFAESPEFARICASYGIIK